MRLSITIPDDVGLFLQDNPGIGRKKIRNEFISMGEMESRIFAAVGRFMHATPEDDSKETEILDKCKVEFNKEETPGKSAKINAKLVRGETIEEGSIVAEVLSETGMDNNHWIPYKIKVKRWNTGMKMTEFHAEASEGHYEANSTSEIEYAIQWSVAIEFKYNDKAPYYDALVALADNVPPLAAPVKIKFPRKRDNKIAAEISMADVHFGKLACGAETLLGNMDLNITATLFNEAADALLERVARERPAKIYIPIGHDLFHYENLSGTTSRSNHILDTDSRLPKVFEVGERCMIRLFDKAIQIAPTKGIWVPGNHDDFTSFAMSRVLKQRYEACKHVEIDLNRPEHTNSASVDSSLAMMKAFLWGKTLIGLCHNMSGAKMKRGVDYFKDVFRELYGQCRWSELHTGHLHKKSDTKLDPVVTIGRTIVRILSGLSTVDRWHLENFFTDAVPAAEAFILHKDDGVVANYPKNVDYLKFD